MSLDLQAIQAIAGDMPPAQPGTGAVEATGRFGEWFTHELGKVNDALVQAQNGVQELATGQAANLHDVMIRLEEARLSLQLATQVRARVMEAYQDVMRMQV